MVHQIVFHTVFSRLPGGLGQFADGNSMPQNLTTTVHPVLTVAILLTYLPLLVGRLFQRCHLSRIDEVLKCGDSMTKTLHAFPNSIKLSVHTTFGACDGSKNFNKFFPPHVRILVCTDLIESIEWQDRVPRQRTGDCFEIRNLSLRTL